VSAEDADMPRFNVFTRRGGLIRHFLSGEMGGVTGPVPLPLYDDWDCPKCGTPKSDFEPGDLAVTSILLPEPVV